MTISEAKQQFIDFIYSRPVYRRMVKNDIGLLLTRCPYCGDSRTTLNTGHLYIWVEPNNDKKMGFVCQRCKEHGVVSSELVSLLGGDTSLLEATSEINKKGVSGKRDSIEKQFKYFDVTISDVVGPNHKKKIDYIESRLDISIDSEKLQSLKIVTSMYDFLIHNDIKKIMFKPEAMTVLERDYVGFLSVGNSHILCRDITNTHKEPWLKYPIFQESASNNVLFSYDKELDVFSQEPITVNFAEGVFDTIGVKEYFNKGVDTVDIAMCGKNYYATIKYLVNIGLIGSNVSLNIYLDNDREYNGGRDISLPKYILDVAKSLFGKVSLIYNKKGKDYGVKRDEIILERKFI